MNSPHHAVRRQPVAAVNDDDRAVDEGAGVRAEEDGALLDVADAPEAAERDVAPQSLFDRLGDEPAHAFGVLDGAGRDGVRADAMAPPLDREVARQRVHARLRRRDVELHGRAEVVERRADVEYLAAPFFQLLEGGAADVEGALEVYVNDRPEAVGRKLLGRAEEVAGRAVDRDVKTAEALDRRGDGALDRGEVAHVGGHGQRLAARLVDARGGGLEVFELAADERDA